MFFTQIFQIKHGTLPSESVAQGKYVLFYKLYIPWLYLQLKQFSSQVWGWLLLWHTKIWNAIISTTDITKWYLFFSEKLRKCSICIAVIYTPLRKCADLIKFLNKCFSYSMKSMFFFLVICLRKSKLNLRNRTWKIYLLKFLIREIL